MYQRLLISIDEIKESTGISRSELYRSMTSGRLKYKVVAGRRRVTPADLHAYLNL
jgi:predicted DNA-binding transcriptional regulator AlpA